MTKLTAIRPLTDFQIASLYALPVAELLKQSAVTLIAWLKAEGHFAGIDKRVMAKIEAALTA
jgi:hypothetical protein